MPQPSLSRSSRCTPRPNWYITIGFMLLGPLPLAERSSESADGLRYGAASGWRVGERIQHRKVVNRAVIPGRGDPDAGIRQPAGVCLALIAEHIVLVDDDKRLG